MELAKTENRNPYIVAITSGKILEMKKSDALKEIIDLLQKTYYDAGQVMPGHDVKTQSQNLQILARAIFEEVEKTFRNLRIEEIKLAFRNGVRKEYGDFFGLNVSTFHGWIKRFVADEKRAEAYAKTKQEVIMPIATESEAFEMWREAIKKQFEQFKSTGILSCEFPTYQFKEFERLGILVLSIEEKMALLEPAKRKLIERKKLLRLRPKNKASFAGAADFLRAAETDTLSENQKEEIKQQARLMAIENYYTSITTLKL